MFVITQWERKLIPFNSEKAMVVSEQKIFFFKWYFRLDNLNYLIIAEVAATINF